MFFIGFLRTEGKKAKTALGSTNRPVCKDRAFGGYFAQKGCKIKGRFTDIFEFQVMCFVLDWSGRWGPTSTSGLLIRIAAQRNNGYDHFHGVAISFLPLF